jgi:hypothetical protein
MGIDAAYSWNRANQTFTQISPKVCGLECSGPSTYTESVSADANEISIVWVGSFRLGGFTPFALAGGGILFDTPTGTSVVTDTVCAVSAPLCPAGSLPTSLQISLPTSNSTTGVFV